MIPHSSFQIWDASISSEIRAWIACWQDWPEREVFAHPNYLSLFAQDGVKALCACSRAGETTILYPFLYRPLEKTFHHCELARGRADIITPYGYGGAFQWGGWAEPTTFWKHFEEWAVSNGVVSELVRFSLFEESLLPYVGRKESIAANIVRSLELDEESLWRDFEHKVRKNVNRAKNEGVTVRTDQLGDCIDEFLEIYETTMSRRSAQESYYFPRSFFEGIQSGLPGQFVYFLAEHNGRVISVELVLVSANRVYSFLGGTMESAFPLRPNDLLKFEVMKWARRERKSQYVLGGGYSPGDGIFRYKESFAPQGQRQFTIGSRIYCPDTYEALVAGRRDQAIAAGQVWQPRSNFFPEYRA